MPRAALHILSSSRRQFCATAATRRDPWPLPHTPEHVAATPTPPPDSLIVPVRAHAEDVTLLRARLTYQSRKRGILETDLLLSTFARDHLPSMAEPELRDCDQVCVFMCGWNGAAL